ncbi:riboflavin-specific deaminase [Coprinopsis sp. MPI-PUGE-AT-0042]|nr:riboflavin-specific deaminase [Coprinopsis sp. MPI-PUGE-AT-0042]
MDYDSLLASCHSDKLNLTVTFAQSLDGKLAGPGGSQIALSCPESMEMTHRLRAKHDAILVGANTAINDNPQLNTRLLPPTEQKNPQPIVLDTHLRLPPNCKLIQNYAAGSGLQPWLLSKGSENADWHNRRRSLEAAGARVLMYTPPTVTSSRADDLPSILAALSSNGIRSLMVEGGPTVIQSFLTAQMNFGSIVDRVIVTVAPTFVGQEGMGYQVPCSSLFKHKATFLAGKDTVIVLDCATP